MNTLRVSNTKPRVQSAGLRKEDAGKENANTAGLAATLQPIAAHEISASRWQDFCNWCSVKLHGIVTDIERDTGRELRLVECLQQPLERISSRVLANGVTAIDVTVNVNGKPKIFEVSGPSWLRLHTNPAGFPALLEIGYEEGKLVLHLTGVSDPAPVFSGNSWGE
jgi:hypothetical protein